MCISLSQNYYWYHNYSSSEILHRTGIHLHRYSSPEKNSCSIPLASHSSSNAVPGLSLLVKNTYSILAASCIADTPVAFHVTRVPLEIK